MGVGGEYGVARYKSMLRMIYFTLGR